LRISAENEKLSITGNKAVILNVDAEPWAMSELITRPWRLPKTAYILPIQQYITEKSIKSFKIKHEKFT